MYININIRVDSASILYTATYITWAAAIKHTINTTWQTYKSNNKQYLTYIHIIILNIIRVSNKLKGSDIIITRWHTQYPNNYRPQGSYIMYTGELWVYIVILLPSCMGEWQVNLYKCVKNSKVKIWQALGIKVVTLLKNEVH